MGRVIYRRECFERECFDAHVTEEASKPEFDGEIYCPCRPAAAGGCTSAAYPGAVIARHATPAAFDALTHFRVALREREISEQMQREFDARLEAEKAKMLKLLEARAGAAKEARLQDAKKHIVDKILTLACPRCEQAFVDFNGCFALTCSRQGCGCGFCAYCLQDCGNDAHAHVAQCATAQGDVFGSMEKFTDAQKTRRERMVMQYLQNLEKELGADARQSLVEICRHEFIDLHMNITAVGETHALY